MGIEAVEGIDQGAVFAAAGSGRERSVKKGGPSRGCRTCDLADRTSGKAL